MTPRPALWLLAGPDGVGKTTYAFRHIRAVSGSVHFINLDEIARGLSRLDPDVARFAAARVALQRAGEMIASRASFSMETTLAGLAQLQIIERARAKGYETNLLYFIVRDVSVCLTRIARRVSEGGHDVPPANVERRFARSLANFPDYASAVDLWRAFDNNGPAPTTVAEGRRGCRSVLLDEVGLPDRLRTAIRAFPPGDEN